jgi:hypothetical protein
MDGELARVAAAQGGFVYRWQALDCGYRESEVARLLRTKQWCTVRRGAYTLPEYVATLDEAGRHALLARAVAGALDGRVVLAGYTALAVRGVPLWGVDLRRVHVFRDGARTSRTDAGVVHHLGPPADRDVGELDGLLVARSELALADAARTVPFEAGVVLADGVLRRLRPDAELLSHIVREEQRDWRGALTSGRVLDFADGDAETVGESRSRVMLARIGVPPPRLQHPFHRAGGDVYARTDFWIEEFATAGEFDGKQKYGRALYEQSGVIEDVDLGEVLWAEKRREDEIRSDGAEMVRWVWSELDGNDRAIRGRFEAAFTRSGRRLRAG